MPISILPVLHTARLTLRPGRMGDAAELFETYTGQPDCSVFLARHPHGTVADTERFIQRWCIEPCETPSASFALLATLENDLPIGLLLRTRKSIANDAFMKRKH